MGIAQIPASSGGLTSAVKSIQRGVAASAGNITITAVDTTKTIVNSFSTGSAGSVAATGTVNAFSGTVGGSSTSTGTINSASINVPGGARFNNFPIGGTAGSYSPRYGVYSVSFTSGNAAAKNLNAMNINATNVNSNAMNITGGSTSLTTAVYGVYLVNSTTITATGPCRYEVIEYF
jgi:hypothetical protein